MKKLRDRAGVKIDDQELGKVPVEGAPPAFQVASPNAPPPPSAMPVGVGGRP